MFREKIPTRQLTAWLFTAMTPVLIQFLGGTSWFWILLAGIGSLVAQWAVRRWGSETESRWPSALQFVFIIVLLGQLASAASQSWPVGNSYPAVPLFLLVLAAWSAQKGTSAAARVGCVLFWAVLIMHLVVFGAGIREMEYPWFVFSKKAPDWQGILVFLTPAAALSLEKKGKGSGKHVLPILFTLFAAVITSGVLSPSVASVTNNAFYEMSRSLSLLGVAKRFEALISAAMTVGWFALMSLYLSIAGQYSEKVSAGWGRAGVWIAAAVSAGWMLCGLHIQAPAMAISAAVFWVGLPILAQGIEKIKKS